MFVCDQCGICCRHLAGIAGLAEYDRGDGVCRHLVGDLCDIYVSRPIVCRVDEMYEHGFSETLTRDAYEALMTDACRELKKQYGINLDGKE